MQMGASPLPREYGKHQHAKHSFTAINYYDLSTLSTYPFEQLRTYMYLPIVHCGSHNYSS